MAAPVDRRSSAGSRSTPGAGVDRREPAVAQPRDPRRYPAPGDAGATRGAVRHDPRPDRRHHRAAMGSGGLRRRGLRTFVSLGAPIRGGSDGGLLDQAAGRSEEHTSELQSLAYLVFRLLLGKKKKK